jgi:hypothetical protein
MVLGDLDSESLHWACFLERCSEHHNYSRPLLRFGRLL